MATTRNKRARSQAYATTKFNIDPAHAGIDIYTGNARHGSIGGSDITLDIWLEKYHWGDEEHPFDSMRRVVEGVYAKDPSSRAKMDALRAMQQALWVPAGRIQAGAGTPNRVTLLNCFVSQTIDDSMTGIADALKDAMLTMQQGGGIGMDFSTLRPAGAYLQRTGAVASGPLPFMDMWNSMCATIMSAGSRRGAMMAVMSCEHPDIVDFITAKHRKGRLTNFNVSVLATDAFMDAVMVDEDWYLGFGVPRADGRHLFVTERDDDEHQGTWYAYEKWRARDLWDLIMENTYEWSEPGVIFIDRINAQNNLNYCETISATNPCGEQALPPNGCCNLGAVNLARMVTEPFTEDAEFDFDLLERVATIGTRFLDNVIDVTRYPLDDQRSEEHLKRRIGVGITGLANALAQLQVRYGSDEAVEVTDAILKRLKETVYRASAGLARERGSFPLYEADEWAVNSPVYASLPRRVKTLIKKNGIRNGVLLTIAPTGTTSLYAGNVSSGLEPVFLHASQRRVRQSDDSYKTYTVYDYGYLLYKYVKGYPADNPLEPPPWMVTHEDLTPLEHLKMQEVCQRHIDASVSKTINCPQELPFEEFKVTYWNAYEMGLKGCTTYRYSEVRESVLSAISTGGGVAGDRRDTEGESHERGGELLVRPEVLAGYTYKVKWPSVNENYYITINHDASSGQPFELFIQSTSSKYSDWTTAIALMISAIMRRGDDIAFIPRELTKVVSVDDPGYIDGEFYGSLVALIGHTIGRHLQLRTNSELTELPAGASINPLYPRSREIGDRRERGKRIAITAREHIAPPGTTCPNCNVPAVVHQEGCDMCTNCGFSNCG